KIDFADKLMTQRPQGPICKPVIIERRLTLRERNAPHCVAALTRLRQRNIDSLRQGSAVLGQLTFEARPRNPLAGAGTNQRIKRGSQSHEVRLRHYFATRATLDEIRLAIRNDNEVRCHLSPSLSANASPARCDFGTQPSARTMPHAARARTPAFTDACPCC